MAQRDLSIDRLRTVMTALVILHHAAITYGAIGGWFYHEVNYTGNASSLLLTLFCATNQAYFMGFFFLLAGYFTPGSLERKGIGWFIGDRFLRLGLPLLAFGLLLGPLTAGMVNYAEGDGFWACIRYLWRNEEFINGPLWFAQALLIFSLVYCGWRALAGGPLATAERTPTPVPARRRWMLAALAVGAGALAIRQFVPTGQNVIGLQLGFFSSYIFLFAVGIAAWRHDWLQQLAWKNARPWLTTLAIAWPMLPIGIVLARVHSGSSATSFAGGISWTSALYAFWEPFVAWGMIAVWLLVFRAYLNQPSGLGNWLNRRAYAVYIIHPVVLVGASLLVRGWVAPALVKWGVVGLLACVACWLVADPFVRLPGVRRVV